MVVLPLLRPFLRHPPEPPPVLAQVAPFSLVDTQGRPFGSAQLAGRPYVVGFLFTRCHTLCPRVAGAMKWMQETYRRARQDVPLVAITVDPEHDRPEVLAEYARRVGADPSRWTFLTGDPTEVRQVVEESFQSAVGDLEIDGEQVRIAHAGYLLLVDGQGRLRGTYGIDREGREELFHRTLAVVAEPKPRPTLPST
jgi:protein SCO1/2